jgi:hypothetical protein
MYLRFFKSGILKKFDSFTLLIYPYHIKLYYISDVAKCSYNLKTVNYS